jgi:hypothetical protein
MEYVTDLAAMTAEYSVRETFNMQHRFHHRDGSADSK